MKFTVVRFIALVFILGLSLSPVAAQSFGVPPVPANLQVPDGHRLFLATRATGTQNYVCLPGTTSTAAWRFLGPQATLFVGIGNWEQQITTHFLSVNPIEQNLARPTWQHSIDSSRVWGRVRASSTDPNYVAPGAIPWLLVETAGTEAGPMGGTAMTRTTFIHRLNTEGGIAPATGCTTAAEIGSVALVPYTTDYYFYRAKN